MSLPFPVISIGSAGMVKPSPISNNIYLIIGVDDKYHYAPAISYYEYVKKMGKFNITIIKHSGGHTIPQIIVQNLIHKLRFTEVDRNKIVLTRPMLG